MGCESRPSDPHGRPVPPRWPSPATILGVSVPTRREAARLLLSLDPPAWSLRHACAVADVAAWLARAVVSHGTPCDVAAVEAAALLHDVDKTPGGRVAGLRHGNGSAACLRATIERQRSPAEIWNPTHLAIRRVRPFFCLQSGQAASDCR